MVDSVSGGAGRTTTSRPDSADRTQRTETPQPTPTAADTRTADPAVADPAAATPPPADAETVRATREAVVAQEANARVALEAGTVAKTAGEVPAEAVAPAAGLQEVTDPNAPAALEQYTREQMDRAYEAQDPAVTQEAMDAIAARAEAAGPEGTRVMAEAAADYVAEHQFDPDTRPPPGMQTAVQNMVAEGRGADFAVDFAQSLYDRGGVGAPTNTMAREVMTGFTQGADQVQRDFAAARQQVQAVEGRMSTFMAAHGDALSPEQRQQVQDRFRAEAADAYAQYEAASGRLLDVAGAMESTREHGATDAFMQDGAPGAPGIRNAIREGVPDALRTDAGADHLVDAMRTSPPGQLPPHLDISHEGVSEAITASMGNAILGADGRADREAVLDAAGPHAAALGLDGLEDPAVRSAMLDITDQTNVSGLTASMATLGSTLGNIDSPGARNLGGILGVGTALVNLGSADGIRQVSEAAVKGLGAGAGVVSGALLHTTTLQGRYARRVAGAASASLGRAGAIFDGLSGLAALGNNDPARAATSFLGATGAVLSTMGRAALRRAGGLITLAADAAGLGLAIRDNIRENNAYQAAAQSQFEAMGFTSDQAEVLAGFREPTAPLLETLGRGQGPGGTDLSAEQMFERLHRLSPEQLERFGAFNEMMRRNEDGSLEYNDQDTFVAGHPNFLLEELGGTLFD